MTAGYSEPCDLWHRIYGYSGLERTGDGRSGDSRRGGDKGDKGFAPPAPCASSASPALPSPHIYNLNV